MGILNNASIMKLNGIISPGINSLSQVELSEDEVSSLAQIDKSSIYYIGLDGLINECPLPELLSNTWMLISKGNLSIP